MSIYRVMSIGCLMTAIVANVSFAQSPSIGFSTGTGSGSGSNGTKTPFQITKYLNECKPPVTAKTYAAVASYIATKIPQIKAEVQADSQYDGYNRITIIPHVQNPTNRVVVSRDIALTGTSNRLTCDGTSEQNDILATQAMMVVQSQMSCPLYSYPTNTITDPWFVTSENDLCRVTTPVKHECWGATYVCAFEVIVQ